VLFLLRPRQTYLPYALPRDPAQLAYRNQEHQQAYDATRRLPPAEPSEEVDVVSRLKDLAELRESGALTDDEFETAKASVLG
jgi:Short C-terminal domain